MYEYFSSIYPDDVDPEVHREFLAAGDLKGRVVASNQQNRICHITMQEFVRCYGATAGITALTFLPTGGLFIAGGLTAKNIDLISDPAGPFMTTFLDKVLHLVVFCRGPSLKTLLLSM